ncbi:cryptochrome-2 [Mytilinidion resinicola]|uniref:Cryptochrome-2 n=1 Tax=Mytilinidion resinicola TaxID=574789 RepID=A0A6A6YG51_9PEZI|nr:cryptochrome-2 [Mytilinidion resinicola]KAF2807781.1 cryptochrome-2 [Mytilinidion resinicola]
MALNPRVIYWFRTDLRLHDSPALAAALDLKPECFWPIWCWDPHYVYRARVGSNRWQYLLDCQQDLSDGIAKLNPKSKLYVLREAPQTLLPKLFKAWKVTHLVFEKDTDAYARSRDEEVMCRAKEAGVQVIVKYGKTLWDPDAVVKANGNKPTMTVSQLQHSGEKVGNIPRPIPAPKCIPDPGDMPLNFEQAQPTPEPDFNSIHRTGKEDSYAKLSGPNNDLAVPTIEELGIKQATTPHRGGETRALAALDKIIKNEQYTATFEKPNSAPTAFEPQSTTLLSPHLHFGSLSCREFYWRVQDVVDNYKGKASQPPASLTGQLLFRDMYFAAQAKMGWSFSQTVGNGHCRFIPWHLRSQVDEKDGLINGEYNIDSLEAEEWFQRWKTGRTGFPWIDAVMRQLKQEGWIHHLARHSVACFLTRGGCYIDWERGAEVFEELLIDHETACNTGNWQWLSCTAFFSQFYRCYSPIAFPRKTDKTGDFVRQFVPELKDFPAKYIYEPWKAPVQDQRKAKCIIKGDGTVETIDGLTAYPKPMFDFSTRRDICIGGMKNAYRAGLYGNSPQVMNRSWPSAFDDDAEGTTEGQNTADQEKFEEAAHHENDLEINSEPSGKSKNKRKRTGHLDGFLRTQKAMR